MLIPSIKLYNESSIMDSFYEVNERIAVVGSSGNIIGSNKGAKIDSFNRVVRFNHAKVSGYETDVGQKTTDLVINCHVYNGYDLKSAGFKGFSKEFWENHKNANVVYVNTNPPNLGRGVVPERFDFYILSQSGFDLTRFHPAQIQSIPTVGYAFIATLVNFGIKPTLFGFSLPNDKWDHYYEDRPEPSVSHNHDVEKIAILELAKAGLVEIG